MPSSNELNAYIQKSIEEVNPNITFIPKLLRKLNTDEISDLCWAPGSPFYRYFRKKYHYTDEEIDEIYNDLQDALDIMPNGKYKKHLIKNNDIRQAITITMEICQDMIASYRENISGKDILLVDDTITYGQTIRRSIKHYI